MSIIEQYRECAYRGMSVTETARKLGRDPRTVRRAAVKYRLHFQNGNTGPIGDIPEAQWREAAEEGLTKGEAAHRFGMSHSAASRAAKRYGINFRDGRRAAKGGPKPFVSDKEWRALGRKGLSVTEASQASGMSEAVVRKAAQRLGFRWRNVRAEVMRELYRNPEYKARQMRGLSSLWPAQTLTGKAREDYIHLVRVKKFRAAEALEILGVAA